MTKGEFDKQIAKGNLKRLSGPDENGVESAESQTHARAFAGYGKCIITMRPDLPGIPVKEADHDVPR